MLTKHAGALSFDLTLQTVLKKLGLSTFNFTPSHAQTAGRVAPRTYVCLATSALLEMLQARRGQCGKCECVPQVHGLTRSYRISLMIRSWNVLVLLYTNSMIVQIEEPEPCQWQASEMDPQAPLAASANTSTRAKGWQSDADRSCSPASPRRVRAT